VKVIRGNSADVQLTNTSKSLIDGVWLQKGNDPFLLVLQECFYMGLFIDLYCNKRLDTVAVSLGLADGESVLPLCRLQ
jgi:hypothetical protein